MVGAEHDAPELAAVAASVAGPLGVLVDGGHPQERLARTHFANEEAVADLVHHLDRGGDDVLLGLEGLAEQVVEVWQLVAAGDVKWGQGSDRFLAEDASEILEIAIEACDLRKRLDRREAGRQVDEGSVLDGLIDGVGTDGLEAVELGAVHRG